MVENAIFTLKTQIMATLTLALIPQHYYKIFFLST